MSTESIKQQTVVAQVMDEIRNLIGSGAYAPGDKIPTEKELAERFGIGRSSIREAIKIFNYLGVLESKAALGTFVQERSNISSEALTWSLLLGNDDLEEIIDLRGAIELWCLVKLVDKFRNGDETARETIEILSSIVEDMGRLSAEGQREPLIEDDFRFHLAIIESSRNPLFLSIYDTLKSFLFDEIRKSQDDYGDPTLIHAEHQNLLEDIRSGEPYQILVDYVDHIRNIKERVRNQRT